MNEKAPFTLRSRNPDVLTCIANLSNDEVFTPPDFANKILDTLAEAWAADHDGENLWANPDVKFLDPCAKSGVFLREITRRLVKGLKQQIPDLQERVNHILGKQVFGIGITWLTALMARRSVYCSKTANGPHSVAKCFDDADGNIWFQRMEHTWHKGRCKYCGASEKTLKREEELETHAYAFIHTDDVRALMKEAFGGDMQFDVIIGNPPYQLDDGGHGASALPIYHKFIEQAIALEPRYLTMVVPSRWLFGGRGLDAFRSKMLNDERIRKLVDFPDSRQAFPNVDVAGGICYFLWSKEGGGGGGDCEVVTHDPRGHITVARRPLLEKGINVFIRNSAGISILKKIHMKETGEEGILLPEELRFERQVSGQKPFGLRTYFRGRKTKNKSDILLLQSGGRAWIDRMEVREGKDLIDKWKVFTSKSSSEHAGQPDKQGMRRVLSRSGLLAPPSAVTETYIILGAYESRKEAENCLAYVTTKFFRFLITLRTSAQDLPRNAYAFIPILDFYRPWTDEDLYERYGLEEKEIELIESFIRPMQAEIIEYGE